MKVELLLAQIQVCGHNALPRPTPLPSPNLLSPHRKKKKKSPYLAEYGKPGTGSGMLWNRLLQYIFQDLDLFHSQGSSWHVCKCCKMILLYILKRLWMRGHIYCIWGCREPLKSMSSGIIRALNCKVFTVWCMLTAVTSDLTQNWFLCSVCFSNVSHA